MLEISNKSVGGARVSQVIWGASCLVSVAFTAAGLWTLRGFNIGLLVFAAFTLFTFSEFRSHRREAKILKDPNIRDTLAGFRRLKGLSFDDACRQLDAAGSRVDQGAAVLADPRSWGKRQRVATYSTSGFHVVVLEKSSRVCRVQVFDNRNV